ncbi:MAG: SO2930 family diheme c-type cytochrome [Phenylobacterium sp.]|uniref:SO2930 family diheme c-type cytochrome n=1 Tax=Phenylobacterium sp. TaxID=1871053 RepID=UPI0027354598|nr:SO2930 family diheme c-type cytochrome [Phenylobacterium sp.]MDP3747115.1 SO2930 family diheme c-type cytochrome [Phenylobacterium sp.]
MKRLAAILAAAVLLGATPQAPPVALDALLAETPAPTLDAYRLFVDAGARSPNGRVTPYGLNTPLFSDYAEKFRFVFLPPGKAAAYTAAGALDFPVGTTLVKTFAYPADFRRPGEKVRFLETRLLVRKADGWTALAYVWNDDQTVATLKRAGTRLDVSFIDAAGRARQVDYAVPNVNQCKDCHAVAGEIAPLGPKARNLNGAFAYASGPENQLARWSRMGMLTGVPNPTKAPRTAVWDDVVEPLAARADAYLDANCAHCHNARGMASNSGLFLEVEETRPAARGIGKRPVAAGRGSGGLEVSIAPGDPAASILLHRMRSDEPGVMMPELGRSLVHDEGVALIAQYIAGLEPAR